VATPDVIRIDSAEICEATLAWLESRIAGLPSLVCLEGLPYSGKSTLLSLLPAKFFSKVELDQFVDHHKTSTAGWTSCIRVDEARLVLDRLRRCGRPVVLEGPAVWKLADILFPDLDRVDIVRIYLKQMSAFGDGYCWEEYDRAKWLSEHDQRLYFQEIWRHHLGRPWEDADLIIERLPKARFI
jgi:hypothetical protein